MSKNELAIIPRNTLPVVLGPLPPRPVWADQIRNFQQKAAFIFPRIVVCVDRSDFDALKALSTEGVQFKKAILASYFELTQAIDAIKQPILDQRNEDVSKVENMISAWDGAAKLWMQKEQAKADEEAAKKRKEEFERRQAEAKREAEEAEAKRLKELELSQEWGDEATAEALVEAGPVVPEEVEMPRAAKADIGLTYRKGSKTKKKPVFQIENPEAVNRAFCKPDPTLYNARIKNYFALLDNPTKEQIKYIEEEIGGGKIEWV